MLFKISIFIKQIVLKFSATKENRKKKAFGDLVEKACHPVCRNKYFVGIEI